MFLLLLYLYRKGGEIQMIKRIFNHILSIGDIEKSPFKDEAEYRRFVNIFVSETLISLQSKYDIADEQARDIISIVIGEAIDMGLLKEDHCNLNIFLNIDEDNK